MPLPPVKRTRTRLGDSFSFECRPKASKRCREEGTNRVSEDRARPTRGETAVIVACSVSGRESATKRKETLSSASAAHLERLCLRQHEPFLLGEGGDRLLLLGRGRLLLLGGHRAAEGAPRAPECGGKEDSGEPKRARVDLSLSRDSYGVPVTEKRIGRCPVREDEFGVY